MADAAARLAARGLRVVVFTANRGYNDPSSRYKSREVIDGVEIIRLPFSSFGKGSILVRVLAQSLFLLQCIVRGVFTRGLKAMLVSTSPPMCSAAAMVISSIRGAPIKYWVMDLNPDQMVEMGWIKPTSPAVKLLDWFNRRILKRATDVIALDRFMADRLLGKLDIEDKLTIIPPWPLDGHLEIINHEDNPFRQEHKLNGKFVIMYSGNHSVCTPLRTILDAALQMQDVPNVVFMFIGDGSGKKEVDDTIAEHKPNNIVSLPYQPLSQIKYSLSAADVHLVVVGPSEVGVRHPCKVYGAMALSRPILLVGPDPCHASDLVDAHQLGWHIPHGDVDGAIARIKDMVGLAHEDLQVMGDRGRDLVKSELSEEILCKRFCDIVANGVKT